MRRYPAPAGPEATLDLRGLPAGCYLLLGAGPAHGGGVGPLPRLYK
ncbi:hypothetical protein [Hymenobacter rubidus]|nr:hypothetical protein [Hymenobacter rubidus]